MTRGWQREYRTSCSVCDRRIVLYWAEVPRWLEQITGQARGSRFPLDELKRLLLYYFDTGGRDDYAIAYQLSVAPLRAGTREAFRGHFHAATRNE